MPECTAERQQKTLLLIVAVAYNVQAKRRCGPPHTNEPISVAGRNGANTLHLAQLELPWPIQMCERRFAVC